MPIYDPGDTTPNVSRLRVITTYTRDNILGTYIYHTEYVGVVSDVLLYGWITDSAANIPDPNPHEGVSFERGELGKQTDDPSKIDGALVDGNFIVTGNNAGNYSLIDGELTFID